MNAHLDIDDVVSGHPVAQQELDQLRAENASIKLATLKQVQLMMDSNPIMSWGQELQKLIEANSAEKE